MTIAGPASDVPARDRKAVIPGGVTPAGTDRR